MNEILKRNNLVRYLKKEGIKNARVLEAIKTIPRHFFFNSTFQQFAYDDVAFHIGEGQCISQPYTVAYQTELLGVKKGDKVLEIGTGSGYQAAILTAMGANVYTLERNKKLHEKASALLSSLGYKVNCLWADGYNGLSEFAPFDRIIVTTAPTYLPETLLEQLSIDGILVIPVGTGEYKTMKKIKKVGDDNYVTKDYGLFC